MTEKQEPAPQDGGRQGPEFRSTDYIVAARERVFEYLTRGEHTRRYYLGMAINDPVRSGQEIWFGADPEASPIVGEVTAYEPPRRFAHTFQFRSHGEAPTEVEFRLLDVGDSITRLETRHHGFVASDSPTYQDVSSGWPAILSGLKTVLETGEAIRWPASPPTPEADGGAP